MTSSVQTGFLPRSSRKPLSVQVVTRPALRRCWSVNVSNTGIGLVARPRGPQDGPREGEEIDLEFSLPGVRLPIRATGEVRWRHDAEASADDVIAALGVSFRVLDGAGKIALTRYVLEHEVNVVVAFASAREAAMTRE